MTEPLLIQRQHLLLRELARLAEERARAEAEIEAAFKARNDAAEQEFQETTRQTQARYDSEKPAADREYQETLNRIHSRYASEHSAAEKEYTEARRKTIETLDTAKQRTERDYEESRWTIATLHEANKNDARDKVKKIQRTKQKIAAQQEKAQTIQQETRKVLDGWKRSKQVARIRLANSEFEDSSLRELRERVATAETQLTQLKALVLPRFCKPVLFIALFILLCAAMAYPAWLLPHYAASWEQKYHGIQNLLKPHYAFGVGAGIAALLVGVLAIWVFGTARRRVQRICKPLLQALADARVMAKQCLDNAEERHQAQLALVEASRKRRDDDTRLAKQKAQQLLAEIQERRETDIRQMDEKYPRLQAEIKQRRDVGLRQLEEKFRPLLPAIQKRYDQEMKQAHDKRARLLHASKQRHDDDWSTLAAGWHQGVAKVYAAITEINQESARLFPGWDDPGWKDWVPPTEVPPALRFGEYSVNLEQIPHAVPTDHRLRPQVPLTFTLPALLPFPRRCSMLFKCSHDGRAQAVQALQSMMLRFLTSIPPSKVRFTIIDPVGLGENFAAFMHLADYDEALVNSRIWTEQAHIEQRLADLTAHMENVIQKYLRNQYPTIEDYNAQAGEVAEPYRILVVANFPINFTSEAARRLVSIANSGAGCGVYTLITLDTKQQLPEGLNLKDLEQPSVNFVWKDQRFLWKDPDSSAYPLKLDAPPSSEFCTDILNVVGEQARLAKRVEVGFEFIAPTAEQFWHSDSRGGIRVPLGRAGATKRQFMQLGQGTAQHVLIAGKTGSGKSTLLHALITNLALYYSPDEVQLYLVDFKKGVEFKTYASHELPHARVVAIESEREFGLSVLQRLDAELRTRGERFRELQVQNLNDYRDATGGAPCPRILLIVDEFQEFFVEDDKVAQEAALLLDRLVRQGRAFGLHILLGSQTLGGAYSLARSTIDQMAVRIALQCSEADAYLILSKDNSAARLLSRPGEAIYNAANGLLEGNDLFQVVWLPDERREQYLTLIQKTAQQRPLAPVAPQIVFEGNAPADVAKNHLLNELLEAPTWPAAPRSVHAWLGEAIAIKDPTAAIFRPQSSSNLLIVGQQDEAVLSMLVTSLVSLAAQHALPEGPEQAGGARFYVLDGTPVDSPLAGYLGRLPDVLPQPLKLASWRDVPAVLNEVAAEVDRRQKSPDAVGPTLYLFVQGMHRFRDLRKADDDFGFSRRGEERAASPAKQFVTILREGPAVGVFTWLWCDTLNNVNRALDRQALREFEMRVLFQMSVADSSTLIDSPAASRLGMHRALFFSEDRGLPEKFRPYGLPSEEWLQGVQKQLQGRLAQTSAQ